jgi:hypothetical protein
VPPQRKYWSDDDGSEILYEDELGIINPYRVELEAVSPRELLDTIERLRQSYENTLRQHRERESEGLAFDRQRLIRRHGATVAANLDNVYFALDALRDLERIITEGLGVAEKFKLRDVITITFLALLPVVDAPDRIFQDLDQRRKARIGGLTRSRHGKQRRIEWRRRAKAFAARHLGVRYSNADVARNLRKERLAELRKEERRLVAARRELVANGRDLSEDDEQDLAALKQLIKNLPEVRTIRGYLSRPD